MKQRLVVGILVLVILISACVPTQDSTNQDREYVEDREPIPPEDCVCIALWDPVCGVDGKTYSNSCYADCVGVEIDHIGECF